LHPIDQPDMAPEMVRVSGLKKVYKSGQTDLVLFENLSFQVRKGEMLAIVGESGAGKSSLLHILGALDRASAGDVYCAQIPVATLTDDAAADFRNRRIGIVWQFHYLLPEFTAQENVAMPLLIQGTSYQTAMEKAAVWLKEVGLEGRAHHRAGELSGGEQQRVALARALITGPEILMADEPTGDLDNRTAEMVFALVQKIHREHRLTSLIVTHNLEFARRCDRVLRLHHGIAEEVTPSSLTN
jgi:lipoprotein-releasing system ATP-binding protein